MKALELLLEARRLEIELWAEGGKLRYRGASEALSAELLAELAAHKSELLAFLEQARPAPRVELPAISASPRDREMPCSFAQRRLWFLHQLDPSSPVYNEPGRLALDGALDVAALSRSFSALITRHEVLRTTFTTRGGEPRQRIGPPWPLLMPAVDLRALAAAARARRLDHLSRLEARRPFDLERGPLLRLCLVRQSERSHALLLTLHHLVNDGWSMRSVFAPELAACYRSYLQGEAPKLPPAPLQYADFAVWQHQVLAGELLSRELTYWRHELAGRDLVLELPTDRPRGVRSGFRGEHLPTHLGRELTDQLGALAASLGVGLFAVLLATLRTLLARLSGQVMVNLGVPVPGRPRPELASLLGFFVNTQVLATRLDGEASLAELARREMRTLSGAEAHSLLPFEVLVEELRPERVPGRHPFFQLMFAFQPNPREGLVLPDLEISFLELSSGTAKFELGLSLELGREGLEGFFQYASDLFDRTSVQRIARQFATLLRSAVEAPHQPLLGLELLDVAERHQLLAEWNDSSCEELGESTLDALVERHCRLRPDALAVVHRDEAWSFAALAAASGALAVRLIDLGVGPEVLVSLRIERSPRMVAAILAVLRAGGAYVPLELSYPEQRLAFMQADSRAAVLLTESHLGAGFHGEASVLMLDLELATPSPSPCPAPWSLAAPDNLAYVMYTSGSSGRPKGVLIHHRGICRVMTNTVVDFDFQPGHRVLQMAALSFDVSVIETFTSLASGSTLVLLDDEIRLSPVAVAELLEQRAVTSIMGPTSFLNSLPERPYPDLAKMIVGGDTCSRESLERWAVGRDFFNCYAPTEATIYATSFACRDRTEAAPPVGRVIPGAVAHLLDRGLRPVPIGVVGEFFLGGVALARGYLARPGLSAERFLPDPTASSWGGRLYRTGDLGRRRSDGELEFVGRFDQQVKLRGVRIELGEVEANLLEHAAVAEAVVMVRSTPGGEVLVAYVVLAGEAGFSPAALRNFLTERLPPRLVPAVFVQLPELPLNENGKVDRRALPDPRGLSFEEEVEPAASGAPQGPIEEVLALLAAELLGLERVRMSDGFFQLGGHSLLVTRLVARLFDELGVELPLRAVFEAPSLGELAREISHLKHERLSLPPIAAAVGEASELTFAEQRLWFLDQLKPGDPAYNMAGAFALEGELQLAPLRAAVSSIVATQVALRSHFTTVAGSARRRVAPAFSPALPLVDLKGLPSVVGEQRGRALLEVGARRPFDLEQGPLFRLGLVQLAPARHLLVVCFHHIIADGAAVEIFFRQLGMAYEAAREHRPSPLTSPLVELSDVAAWQRRALTDEALAGEILFWREALAGAHGELALHTDRPRPAEISSLGGVCRRRLDNELVAKLVARGRESGATVFMTLAAVLSLLLSRLSGQKEVILGTPVSGRTRSELEGLIGFLVNTLALRTQLAGANSFRSVLARLRATALAAYGHQTLPFERLVDLLGLERDLAITPLFQVFFVLQTSEPFRPQLAGLSVTELPVASGATKFDLTFLAAEGTAGFELTLQYRRELFDASTAERLLASFAHLLAAALANPEASTAGLPLLGAAQSHQLLLEWNDSATGTTEGGFVSVGRRLRLAAARTPDRPAVIAGGEVLTFQALFDRAEVVATLLAGRGVGPGMVVAVAAPRSVAAVVGIFGTVLAGAAYLPLDPNQPPARLLAVVEDASAALLLVTGGFELAHHPVLDLDWVGERGPAPVGVREPLADELVYVIYTSGTTGKPKGVMVTHGSLANLLAALEERLYNSYNSGYNSGASPLHIGLNAPLVFDAAVKQLFQLVLGRTLCLVPEEIRTDGAELGRWLVQGPRLDALDITPSQLRLLFAGEGSAPAALPRRLLVAGEALEEGLWRRLGELPDTVSFNLYGPTECTVDATVVRLAGERPMLGRPLANVCLLVVDRRGESQPIGVPGELAIGGAGVARGYLGRPGLTAARFVPAPGGFEPGARQYLSGDLVRQRADGAIEFLGRADHQVKVRGYRIELEEIEAALARHPAVAQVAVKVPDEPDRRRLVAYVVARATAVVEETELRAYLRERLPEYMVPALFVALPALPLAASGKVNRRALPAPETAALLPRALVVAPRSPVEVELVRIWSEVLGLPEVGVHDNFFAIGGDSILTIQIVSRARRRGLVLTPRQIFQHQTIAELAGQVKTAGVTAGERKVVTGEVPLTPIQRRFFALDSPRPEHYNQTLLLVLEPAVTTARLLALLRQWPRRHEALRLRFRRNGPAVVQEHGSPESALAVGLIDLAALAVEHRRAQLEGLAARAQASLDLAAGPLGRAVVFGLGQELGRRLLLLFHHLVIDGVSWRVLLEELSAAITRDHQGLEGGPPRDIDAGDADAADGPSWTSYQQWAEALAARASSAELAAEVAFWEASCRGPVARLPVELEGGANERGDTDVVEHRLSREQTSELLGRAASALFAKVDEVLLAAVAVGLKSWTRGPALRIDLEGHGRALELEGLDVSRTVGWFTAVFPLRLDGIAPLEPVSALVEVKERLRAVPDGGVGYGLVSSRSGFSVGDEAEVVFNYLGQLDALLPAGAPFTLAEESPGAEQDAATPRRYRLEIQAAVRQGELVVAWVYSRRWHRRSSVAKAAEAAAEALVALLAAARRGDLAAATSADFPLAGLTPAELTQVLAAEPSCEDIYPLSPLQEGMLFHSLLEPQGSTYFEQLHFRLAGTLEPAAFWRACRWLVERHGILRTVFRWQGLKRPLQLVRRAAPPRLHLLDTSSLPPGARAARFSTLLAAGRQRGIDPTVAPPLAWWLVREAPAVHLCVIHHHHLLLDGWCLPILLSELFAAYGSEMEGQSLKLPRPRPYRDYIAYLESRDPSADEAYWRSVLGDFREPLPFGLTRRGAEAVIEAAPGHSEVSLTSGESAALGAFARRCQVTLNTVVQGAFALLLARLTGEPDVVFGATVAGRSLPLAGIESMIGLFINSLPVRIGVDSAARLGAWLSALQRRQIESRSFEATPLTEVQGWSAVARSQPLFRALLVFENYPLEVAAELLAGKGTLRLAEPSSFEKTNYPWNLVCVPGERLLLRAIFARQSFEPSFAARLLRNLAVLLTRFATAEQAALAELSPLSAAERWQLLGEWNQAAGSYPTDASLAVLFERQVATTPSALAVSFGGSMLSFAELDERASQLAAWLAAAGVGLESLVGLGLERSLEMVVAMVAILKAGAAYVPIDPAFPAARRELMMADAGVKLLFTESSLASAVLEPSASMRGGGHPDALAYVIYTSGSTGQPKGVAVPQRAVARLVLGTNYVHLGAGQRIAQAASASFDAATFEVWGGLLTGAAVVGFAREQTLTPASFAAGLRAAEISVLFLTTALFHQISAAEPTTFSSLDSLLFGGESVDAERVERVLRSGAPRRLLHVYGPTENTTFSTWHRVRVVRPEDATVPIGRTISHSNLVVVDRLGGVAMVGALGELLVGGDGLARGYLHQPAKTATSFVPDAATGVFGGRLYRSGDLVRWNPQGAIEFVGRRDHQIKLRGFRIELGEIEAALLAAEGVAEVVVLLRARSLAGGEDRQLVAYVVPSSPDLKLATLRAELAARLPEHAIPGAFVVLPSLPLNRNGKIDRAALPAPEEVAVDEEQQPTRALRPTEEILLAIWQRVLGVKEIVPEDSFFELGGHSLLATRLIAEVRTTFNVEVTIRSLFEAPTLESFAAEVDRWLGSGVVVAAVLPSPAPRPPRLPLSLAQERLWFLDRLAPLDPSFNITGGLRLSGCCQPATIAQAFATVVSRHEVLRTSFRVDEQGEPYQVIAPRGESLLRVVDLSALPAEAVGARALILARREAHLPFVLEQGPLLRARLLRFSATRHELLVTLHHIVADGWSMGIFLDEWAEVVAAAATHREPLLAPLPLQYADYALWERESLAGDHLEGLLAVWRSRLARRPPPLDLPFDRPRRELRRSAGASRTVLIDRALTAELLALSRGQGVTLFMTLLAGYLVMLSRFSGETDLLVGTSVANRGQAAFQGLIGFFANILALRTDLGGDPTFAELLGRVRATALAAYAHEQLPFDRLIDELKVERDPSRPPLVQVALTLNDAHVAGLRLPGLEVEPLTVETETAKVDLTFSLYQLNEGLRASAQYAVDLFDATTILRLQSHFEALLRAGVANPQAHLSRLEGLLPGERQQLLREWNDTEIPDLDDHCLDEVVAAVAARRPEAVAVSFGEQTLSYGELERRAAALAGRLSRLGVGPEVKVTLRIDRSLSMVPAILGVLKAGAAFVPLEITYPAERLAFLQEDCGAPVLITASHLAALEAPAGATVVDLDAAGVWNEGELAGPPTRPHWPDSLAYVMYTSGSTGKPKGVEIRHRAVCRVMANTRENFAFGCDERILQMAALSFDVSVVEIFLALTSGSTLLVVDTATRVSAAALGELLVERAVSCVMGPTSLLNTLPEGAYPDLRTVLVGGDTCSRETAQRWAVGGRRLFNCYAPTEATIYATQQPCHHWPDEQPPIGRPIQRARVYLVGRDLAMVPLGVVGELVIGGQGVARGYLGRPALTADRFLPDAFGLEPGARLYRTGDLGRLLPDGRLTFIGRFDTQVKVRGVRIELGEVEAGLRAHEEIEDVVVVPRGVRAENARLVAYYVTRGGGELAAEQLRAFAATHLPSAMVPAAFVHLPALPLTPNGKIDRKALPEPEPEARPAAGRRQPAPEAFGLEARLQALWCDLLDRETVGLGDNFFDLGGNSLSLVRLQARLKSELGHEVRLVDLFQFPTLRALVDRLGGSAETGQPESVAAPSPPRQVEGGEIAIIGLAGRFPGAASSAELWRNLLAGVESIRFYSREEVLAAGVDPALVDQPGFVAAKGALDDAELFDAPFFGFTPRDAELTDPQQRQFLEVAWHALEDAACDPARFERPIGVFAGSSTSDYVFRALDAATAAGKFNVALGNDRDFLATRLAYKLDLKGPAMLVQTACSTSLVAVHLAVESLLGGHCDVALAGGVSVRLPYEAGHVFEPDGIYSPDGHCRAFAAEAQGTVAGNGVGVVVLKRLRDALADGDHIRAVLRATAINNDGAEKVGYAAPSVQGQARVLAQALARCGIEPGSVGLVEAHGTGTELGDPIELEALHRVYGPATTPCYLGSLKSNLGHLDAAAGVAGLIKVVLAVEHGVVPPTLHAERPNPELRLASSRFHLPAAALPWPAIEGPRRAAVSSFGIGGTNAHVVVEEAPPQPPTSPGRQWQVLPLSARSAAALEQMVTHLAAHLAGGEENDLADLAFTLATGRRAFTHRIALLTRDGEEARHLVEQRGLERRRQGVVSEPPPSLIYIFSGQGSLAAAASRRLYAEEPVYRRALDHLAELFRPELGVDLRRFLAAADNALDETELIQTRWAQPALFACEMAMVELLASWGLNPTAMIGHSIGELVAATVAGVFRLEDAVSIVAARGRLMQEQEPGAMLSVSAAEAEVRAELGAGLEMAAINGPGLCVVAGPETAITAAEARFAAREITCRRLSTSHAFHTASMDGALPGFRLALAGITLSPPRLPFVSNLTGTWITDEQATDPEYWLRHLRQTVLFGAGLNTLFSSCPRALAVEVGPGHALTTVVRRHPDRPARWTSQPTLVVGNDDGPPAHLALIAALWVEGVELSWEGFFAGQRRKKVAAPLYAFERRPYLLGSGRRPTSAGRLLPPGAGGEHFYLPAFKPLLPAGEVVAVSPSRWLLLDEGSALGAALAARIEAAGLKLARANLETLEACLAALPDDGLPWRLVHLLNLEPGPTQDEEAELEAELERGLGCLVRLGRCLSGRDLTPGSRLTVVTRGLLSVAGEPVRPIRATLLGACRTLPLELPGLDCRLLDLGPLDLGAGVEAAAIWEELWAVAPPSVVALRGGGRWAESYELVELAAQAGHGLRQGGVYLITGGLGGVGLEIAALLAREVAARLVLVGRRAEPSEAARQRLRELEAAGAQVLVLAADVTHRCALDEVVATTLSTFGRIDGVVHAAGLPASGLLALSSWEAMRRVLAPKLEGTLNLLGALAAADPEFVLLCSSQSALIGLPGRTDYTAANAFLDAVAVASAGGRRPRVVAVNWDTWSGVGMASASRVEGFSDGLAPAAACAALLRLLAARTRRLVISAEPLEQVAARARALDVRALLALERPPAARPARPELSSPYLAPRTPLERQLAAIWAELLGVSEVGVEDSFFELGGDSVLGLQVVSRARQAGLGLALADLFEQRTIAGIAGKVRVVASPRQDQVMVAGAVPLVPMARWLLSRGFERPHHFNLSVRLELPPGIPRRRLLAACQGLWEHHDALRLRLSADAAVIDPPGRVAFSEHDLSPLSATDAAPAANRAAAVLAAAFDLARGPLVRFVHLAQAAGVHQLLIVAHHLVVDLTSWQILLTDLDLLLSEPRLSLPPRTDSYARFAAAQLELGRSPALRAELPFWNSNERRMVAPLPCDFRRGRATVATSRSLVIHLDAGTSRALLETLPERLRLSPDLVLLAALGLALSSWRGVDSCLVDLEIDGRSLAEGDLDLSRTVGWLTTFYPFLVRVPEGRDPAAVVALIRDQLSALPRRGAGYLPLRFPAEGAADGGAADGGAADGGAADEGAAELPAAEIALLFAGSRGAARRGRLVVAEQGAGPPRWAGDARTHLLELAAQVEDGVLALKCTYSNTRHRRASIAALMECFRAAAQALAELPSAAAPRYLAADFPLARCEAASLERLAEAFGPTIEDLYPLSPLQQGLVFEELYNPASEVYRYQLHSILEGELEVGCLARALRAVLTRHPVLRSAFVWEGINELHQVVIRSPRLPLALVDWQALAPEAQAAALDLLLLANRRKGFELGRPPLMRMILARTSSATHHLIWLYHHLILDGWSLPLVLSDLFNLYAGLRNGREPQLPSAAPYRNFIAWLLRQDLRRAEAFWRGYLAGFRVPNRLPGAAATALSAGQHFAEHRIAVSEVTSRALEGLARGEHLTLNSVLQVAWALVLAASNEELDVVFGATVAGRPPSLDGAEGMVGMFINTLPVRIELPRAATLGEVLAANQRAQLLAREFDFSPLVEVQRWSEVPATSALFSTNLVFESFPVGEALSRLPGDLVLSPGRQPDKTNSFPLVLVVVPGRTLELWLTADRAWFDSEAAARLTATVEAVLELMAEPAATQYTLAELLPRLDQRLEAERAARLAGVRQRGFARLERRPVKQES